MIFERMAPAENPAVKKGDFGRLKTPASQKLKIECPRKITREIKIVEAMYGKA